MAPGPRVTKQTPGRPVTLPMASAIIAGAGLLPAHRDGDIAVMECVQHREIALAGHAEDMLHAVDAQLVDQNFGGTAQIVLGAHFTLPGRPHPGPQSAFALPYSGPELVRDVHEIARSIAQNTRARNLRGKRERRALPLID